MSVFYNRIERGTPSDTNAPKKWYPVLKTIEQIGESEVARLIADETTLNPKEAEMAIDQLHKVLIRELLNSKSIKLGNWGSFHLTCNSKGSDRKDEAGASNILNLNIRFVPGKELKDELKRATFTSAESIVSHQS